MSFDPADAGLKEHFTLVDRDSHKQDLLDNRMTHRHTNKYTPIKSRHSCFRHFNLAVVSLHPPTLHVYTHF